MTRSAHELYQAIRDWAESHSIHVQEEELGAGTAGEFDGVSVTMNRTYDAEERAWYLIHALGSIVLWSRDRQAVQNMFDELRAAEDNRKSDPARLERMITHYRDFETDSSSLAVELLSELRRGDAIPHYTNFMRADLEALTLFHRSGKAPVWREFFRRWNEEIASGVRSLVPFPPKSLPSFHPLKIERQEILQEQGA